MDLVGKWLSVSGAELLCLQIHGELPFGEKMVKKFGYP